MATSIHLFSFKELSLHDLYEALRLREEVFIVEQNCPFYDIDGKDKDCFHVLMKNEDQLMAYSRIVPPGLKFEDAAIGRIIVRRAFRGSDVGQKLIHYSIQECKRLFPDVGISISAQYALVKYYEQFGFKQFSEPYLEDDILHADMKLM
jgi:ElaA protein